MFRFALGSRVDLSFLRKLGELNFGLLFLIAAIVGIGCLVLYSAAGGNISPWADRHAVRFLAGLGLAIAVAMIDLRTWFKWSYPIYALGVALLILVPILGVVGMGARRWIDLGPITIQPSEIMKIGLMLSLARFFHGRSLDEIWKVRWLVIPVTMILAPVALVMKQPDLGTAMLLLAGGAIVFLLAGVKLWKFGVAIVAAASIVPVAWGLMHDYQRQRVLTFLDPDADPLGAGYHILQSKIALGSGGLFGKGFLQGTQSHLNFLPEKQTDFAFTSLAEETGLIGALALLGLYMLLFAYGHAISLRARSQFGRLLAGGINGLIFLYVFINVAMVTGLVPVVGVPLPLVSYGGTAMLTLFFGAGLMMSVWIHRDVVIPRHAGGFGG
jgi:rod shape determining protein RodA